MPFPASQELLFEGLQTARSIALTTKQEAENLKANSLLGPVARDELIRLMRLCDNAVVRWTAVAALPGIGQYAKDQLDDQTIDLAAEFLAMRTQAAALRDWIFNNFPKTGAGWLVYTYTAGGEETDLTFSTVQLADFRTEVDLFTATIS